MPMGDEESGVRGSNRTGCDDSEEFVVKMSLPDEVEGRVVGGGGGIYCRLAWRLQSVGTLIKPTFWGSKARSAASWSGDEGLARRFFEGPL